MRDNFGNPAIIDPAALFISQQEVAEIVDKLRISDTGGNEITIRMNFKDWTVYSGLLGHTSAKIPQSDPDAYDILDALLEECDRLDDAGEAPGGPELLIR
jgi:hypothetical protein